MLAGTALSGCAVPGTPAERLASDLAVCRRHAAEGPGGPSPFVGGRAGNGGTLNRQNAFGLVTLAASAAERINQWQSVFRDCLEQRGYILPRETNRPVDPDAVGGDSAPVIPA